MKIFQLVIFILFITLDLASQDIIILKKDSKEIKVKIESVDSEFIRYQKAGSANKTLFTLPVSDVSRVIFKSGEERVFDSSENGVSSVATGIDDLDENKDKEENPSGTETTDENKSNKDNASDRHRFRTRLRLGIIAGINATTLKYRYNNEAADLGNTFRLSPAGGLMIEWEIWRVFSIYTAFYYKDKGDRINGKSYVADWEFPTDNPIVYTAEGTGKINKHLGYLEWSFLPLFGYTNRTNTLQVQFGGGVYASYGITGKEKIDMSIDYYRNGEFDETEIIEQNIPVLFVLEQIVGEKPENTYYFNAVDYGLIGYFGIKPRPFLLNLQLAYGWANIETLSFESLFFGGENFRSATNLCLTLSAGYMF